MKSCPRCKQAFRTADVTCPACDPAFEGDPSAPKSAAARAVISAAFPDLPVEHVPPAKCTHCDAPTMGPSFPTCGSEPCYQAEERRRSGQDCPKCGGPAHRSDPRAPNGSPGDGRCYIRDWTPEEHAAALGMARARADVQAALLDQAFRLIHSLLRNELTDAKREALRAWLDLFPRR